MPVNTLHPQYAEALPAWTRARDVLAGEDTVKAAGTRYLPRLDYQSDQDYANYKSRAAFFNATARTAEGYLGLIFRRPPFFKVPEGKTALAKSFTDFLLDVDLLGTNLPAYAKNIVTEVIAVGRAGTLVDWESAHENRAYVALYQAEQILNWKVERINGRIIPTMVVLHEPNSGPSKAHNNDPFQTRPTDQIRVLRLASPPNLNLTPNPNLPGSNPGLDALSAYSGAEERGEVVSENPWDLTPETWDSSIASVKSTTWKQSALSSPSSEPSTVCVVDIYQRVKTKNHSGQHQEQWVHMEAHVPKRLGRPLSQIPFIFHGPKHSRPDVDKLPLADIISVNLDHYRLDADYKHGIHFTALPTAWVSGFDKAASLRIGSSTAWVTETPGAAAGFLEFKGDGLQTFERAMDRDERLLAILGSRLLEGQKKVGEAAQAIELRQSGENSILSSLANSVSQSLTQMLQWVYWWNSTEDNPDDIGEKKVLVELNTDFSTTTMDPQEIQAVVAAWQANAISRETMTDLFRRGEVLPEGRTMEEELRSIQKHPLSASGGEGQGEVAPKSQLPGKAVNPKQKQSL